MFELITGMLLIALVPNMAVRLLERRQAAKTACQVMPLQDSAAVYGETA